jgi:hypothetical protein
MTAPAPDRATATAHPAAALARALLPVVLRSLRAAGREPEPALAALDHFLARPAPSTFLQAMRQLRQAEGRRLIESTARPTLLRARQAGLAALREVPGLPPPLLDRLAATLPADARGGQRLLALAALARSYHELAVRVAADTDEMRRRLPYPRRGARRRLPGH